jgi:hypothetical protein
LIGYDGGAVFLYGDGAGQFVYPGAGSMVKGLDDNLIRIQVQGVSPDGISVQGICLWIELLPKFLLQNSKKISPT